jgi:hypothetical protein
MIKGVLIEWYANELDICGIVPDRDAQGLEACLLVLVWGNMVNFGNALRHYPHLSKNNVYREGTCRSVSQSF